MKIIHYIALIILICLVTLIIKYSSNNLIPLSIGALILIFTIDFIVDKLVK